jgi:hypothetical protein
MFDEHLAGRFLIFFNVLYSVVLEPKSGDVGGIVDFMFFCDLFVSVLGLTKLRNERFLVVLFANISEFIRSGLHLKLETVFIDLVFFSVGHQHLFFVTAVCVFDVNNFAVELIIDSNLE